jgi:hypothetical protein
MSTITSLLIAENLNNIHINVYKALQLLKEAYPNKTTWMNITPVTEIEMINTITFLKTKTHQDVMEFLKIFKYYANVIRKPSTFICNSSLASGGFNFPIVQPKYKKGDKL